MAALGQIAADSGLSIEHVSMSTSEASNNDLLSLVKATLSVLDLHQPAVQTKPPQVQDLNCHMPQVQDLN